MQAWSHDLGVGGFAKMGYPGVVVRHCVGCIMATHVAMAN